MSEQNEGGGFAAAASGKSPEEIAFDLVSKLKGQGVWGERNTSDILDLYAQCLDAAKGYRKYEGQNRVDAPVSRPGASQSRQPEAQVSQAAPRPAVAAPQVQQQTRSPQSQVSPHQAAHPQPGQTQPAQVQQPVQAQQQALQQAFRQT